MPTFQGSVDLSTLDNHDYSSHSFRRTLAIAIRLTLRDFDTKMTPQLAKVINTRLQWFQQGSTIPAENDDMLRHYSADANEFHLEYLPEIFRRAAMELCTSTTACLVASPNGTVMLL